MINNILTIHHGYGRFFKKYMKKILVYRLPPCQPFFNGVQLHQCFKRGQVIDIRVKDVFPDLLKQRIVELDEGKLELVLVGITDFPGHFG
jgi:hypothetical protein